MPVSVRRTGGAWPGCPALWAWEVCQLHGVERQGVDGVTGGACRSSAGPVLSPEAGGSFLTSPV